MIKHKLETNLKIGMAAALALMLAVAPAVLATPPAYCVCVHVDTPGGDGCTLHGIPKCTPTYDHTSCWYLKCTYRLCLVTCPGMPDFWDFWHECITDDGDGCGNLRDDCPPPEP